MTTSVGSLGDGMVDVEAKELQECEPITKAQVAEQEMFDTLAAWVVVPGIADMICSYAKPAIRLCFWEKHEKDTKFCLYEERGDTQEATWAEQRLSCYVSVFEGHTKFEVVYFAPGEVMFEQLFSGKFYDDVSTICELLDKRRVDPSLSFTNYSFGPIVYTLRQVGRAGELYGYHVTRDSQKVEILRYGEHTFARLGPIGAVQWNGVSGVAVVAKRLYAYSNSSPYLMSFDNVSWRKCQLPCEHIAHMAAIPLSCLQRLASAWFDNDFHIEKPREFERPFLQYKDFVAGFFKDGFCVACGSSSSSGSHPLPCRARGASFALSSEHMGHASTKDESDTDTKKLPLPVASDVDSEDGALLVLVSERTGARSVNTFYAINTSTGQTCKVAILNQLFWVNVMHMWYSATPVPRLFLALVTNRLFVLDLSPRTGPSSWQQVQLPRSCNLTTLAGLRSI